MKRKQLWIHIARLSVAAVFAGALGVAPAHAQMIPVQDLRENSADATFLGVTESRFEYPPAPWAYFESYVDVFVPNPDPEASGHCEAFAFQISQFLGSGLSMSGGTSGGWQIIPGQYNALSHCEFEFRLDGCHQYQLDAWLLPGDVGESRINVSVPGSTVAYEATTAGEIHTTGRLPAGEYTIEGHSYIQGTAENTEGPTYSVQFVCIPCTTTLIASHPINRTIACGGTATFSVAPVVPHGTLTYQWRRNLVPLADNGQITGSTSPTLTIGNACSNDAGLYDVVLSDGTIIEPSRLATLAIDTITGVEDLPAGREFSLEIAGPNPFGRSTSFRYALAKPQAVTIDVFNAAGARIRTLTKGGVTGSGLVTWDGTTSSGTRAPAGIYFVKLQAGSIRESRKVVLLK